MRNKRKVTELVSPIGKYCTAVDLKKTNEELLETKLSHLHLIGEIIIGLTGQRELHQNQR